MKEAEVDLFPHFLLSYNELSPMLKRCFSYCAVFLKGQNIYVDKLIRNWMALGYLGSEGDMEGRGRGYFDILAMHSLFQDFEKDVSDGRIIRCRMHDIVHDFAQFLRKSVKVEGIATGKTTCRACDPSLISTVNKFCSLFWEYKRSPLNLCYCLKRLRVLSVAECCLQNIQIENLIHLRLLNLRETVISREDLKVIFQLYYLQTLDISASGLKEISKEIGNLIQLRHLNLSNNGSLKKLPREIGNLIHLKHLDLSWNSTLKELPEEIGNSIHLRHLDLHNNASLKELPESLCDLRDLRTLDITCCQDLCKLPEGFGHLTCLRRLGDFHGGRGWNKLRLLKKLNSLNGSLKLIITFVANDNYEEMVEDAHEAQLRNKTQIEELVISFEDEMDENEESSLLRMDVINALEPHPNLRSLVIERYNGSKLPLSWIVSPLNHLRRITLKNCNRLSSLPPLGKLPSSEEIVIFEMQGLQFVGRELLGIATTIEGDINIQSSSDTTIIVAFPKLKKLEFSFNTNLKEWEDITAEEEECINMSSMPCLTQLVIRGCKDLRALPHRLLHKASSLEFLDFTFSTQLQHRYRDKDGSDWKSISQYNPRLQLHEL